MTRHRTYAAIDLDAIEYNYKNVRAKLPDGVKLLAVIKADAYGHGAVEIGRFLSGKCDFFGVACIEEALELKKAGIETPIIVLGRVFPWDHAAAVKYDIRIPIFSLEDALSLSSEAVKQGKTAPFHFALDTGMSRIGLRVTEESADLCARISALSGLFAEGIFSHFATADESDLTKAVAQRDEFVRFMRMLAERGVNIPIKHLNNSAGIINFDRYFDMCRMGILTYGMYPSAEVRRDIIDVKPALSWHARISHIKTLEAGREISYGGTFTTVKPTVVATVPVGYADGYPRCCRISAGSLSAGNTPLSSAESVWINSWSMSAALIAPSATMSCSSALRAIKRSPWRRSARRRIHSIMSCPAVSAPCAESLLLGRQTD